MQVMIISDEMIGNSRRVEMKCRRTSASVTFNSWGTISVCVENASNRCYRGFGRQFQTIEDALAGYKSFDVKMMIHAAAGNLQEV